MASHRLPPSNPTPATFVCWSCQNQKPNAERMMLDATTPIPVCGTCWGVMPVSERIRHAQAFHDRAKGGILAEVQSLIASSFANFVEQRGPDWMRGKDGN